MRNAEDEGLEPPRPRGRRFSRPVSYQLELILQFTFLLTFSRQEKLLWDDSIEQEIDKQKREADASLSDLMFF